GNIGGETELAARPQHARDLDYALVLHEPTLPMSTLVPGVGIEQVDAGERTRRQPIQHGGNIAEVQPDVAELLGFDGRQRARHSIEECLDPHETDPRLALGGRDQMLAAAETDLEADIVHLEAEHARQTE